MVETLSLSIFRTLLHHRWNICVLAELYVASGAKFVTLVDRLEIPRASLSATLSYLVEQGLVARNTGYGHPLRPEYVLTIRGLELGKDCDALTTAISKQSERRIAFRKWSLPLIAVIGRDRTRFNQIREALGNPTPRATTLALKSLEEQQWLQRRVGHSYPPSVSYELSARGLEIWSILSGWSSQDFADTIDQSSQI